MTHDTARLAKLGAERARLTARLATIRPELHAEILAARDAGIGPVEVARLAGMTRDAILKITKARETNADE